MTLSVLVTVLALLWIVSRFIYIGDDKQLSDYRTARLIHQCELEEQAEERRKQRAREHPERYPHDFAEVSFRVRVMSQAELARTTEEKRTLQFLRGDK